MISPNTITTQRSLHARVTKLIKAAAPFEFSNRICNNPVKTLHRHQFPHIAATIITIANYNAAHNSKRAPRRYIQTLRGGESEALVTYVLDLSVCRIKSGPRLGAYRPGFRVIIAANQGKHSRARCAL